MRIQDEAELNEYLKRNPELTVGRINQLTSAPIPAKPHKYHAKRTEYGGHTYASKKEAKFAEELIMRAGAGEITYFLEQVPFPLPAGIKYVADFVTFTGPGGAIREQTGLWAITVYEVKAWWKETKNHKAGYHFTQAAKLKWKLFRETYPLLNAQIV